MSQVIKRHPPDQPVVVAGKRSTGEQECPKCMFSMEPLRDSPVLNRDYGYSLDSHTGWDPDDNVIMAFLFSSLYRFLYRNVIAPLGARWWGERQNRKYRKLLDAYPHSLICTHCEYVLKQK